MPLKPVQNSPDIVIHLYALCWNEARMLPYFFRHYDAIVDRFYIFDNHSTDGSLALLRQHPRVTLESIDFAGSFLKGAQDFYNSCWKASRGSADWVLICNVDEHYEHPDLRQYLKECVRQGVTMAIPEGFEMVSETFPTSPQPLSQQVRTGLRVRRFDKPQLFSPTHIREINFEPGRHSARPEGRVRAAHSPELKLLHYKHLGLPYLDQRLTELGERITPADIANKNHRYEWDAEQKQTAFHSLLSAATIVG